MGDQDRGGAVCGADDADGGGVLQVKAQGRSQEDGEENTGLGGGAAQEQLGVGQQGTEVDHSADADEEQDGEGLTGLDANLKEPLDDAVGLTHALAELIDDAGQGQVDQDGAEAHGQQQGGLKPPSRWPARSKGRPRRTSAAAAM